MRRFIIVFLLFHIVHALESDLTIIVEPGTSFCFFQEAKSSEVLDIEYQVIDSSHGEHDISFQLVDPVGLLVAADYKKGDNSIKHTATIQGDYRFCFDNTFSTFSSKTVFVDLLIESQNHEGEDSNYDDQEMILGTSADQYNMKVQEIMDSVNKVKENISSAKRLQELHSAHEAHDRNLAEDVCSRVLTWSLCQIVIMLLVSSLQVFFLKSLFEDKNQRDEGSWFSKFTFW